LKLSTDKAIDLDGIELFAAVQMEMLAVVETLVVPDPAKILSGNWVEMRQLFGRYLPLPHPHSSGWQGRSLVEWETEVCWSSNELEDFRRFHGQEMALVISRLKMKKAAVGERTVAREHSHEIPE
jgi:hypothetical protein